MTGVRRNRRAFRPRLDGSPLEDRQLLTNSAAPLVSNHGPIRGGAVPAATASFQLVGRETNGLWNLGNTGEQVAIFAVEFQGKFDAATASKAWSYGIQNAANKHLSLDGTIVGNRRTTSQVHELLGWWNPKTQRGGWMAADYGGTRSIIRKGGPWWKPTYRTETHNRVRVLTNSNSTIRSFDDANTQTWNSSDTRGYSISLTMTAVNNRGDIRPTFARPY